MLAFDGVFGFVLLGLWVFCIIDVITTDASLCRNLPKAVWLLLVLLFFDLGCIVWLIAGRPWAAKNSALPYKGNPGYGPPPRARAGNPDDDEEFQATLRHRAEEQRRRAQEQRRADPPPES